MSNKINGTYQTSIDSVIHSFSNSKKYFTKMTARISEATSSAISYVSENHMLENVQYLKKNTIQIFNTILPAMGEAIDETLKKLPDLVAVAINRMLDSIQHFKKNAAQMFNILSTSIKDDDHDDIEMIEFIRNTET